jgi:hypothetical protein
MQGVEGREGKEVRGPKVGEMLRWRTADLGHDPDLPHVYREPVRTSKMTMKGANLADWYFNFGLYSISKHPIVILRRSVLQFTQASGVRLRLNETVQHMYILGNPIPNIKKVDIEYTKAKQFH